MLYIKSVFADSNGYQTLAVIGRPLRDLALAAKKAQNLSVERGVAEVVGQNNEVLAAFRAGQAISGSVLS